MFVLIFSQYRRFFHCVRQKAVGLCIGYMLQLQLPHLPQPT